MTPMHRPDAFWRRPPGAVLRHAACLSAALSAWWFVVYVGTDLISHQRSLRCRVHLDAELALPYLPAMVFPYVSLYPVLFLAPFILPSRRMIDAYAATLAVVIPAAGVSFLLFPARPAYAPAHETGWVAAFQRAVSVATLRYNMVPSLHVALAVVAAAVYAGRAKTAGKLVLWSWAAAVAASTLLTHQHHLLDVVTGWGLGVAGKRWVYDRRLARVQTGPPSRANRPAPSA
jgi:membrane-associated phospholipid phosphatase